MAGKRKLPPALRANADKLKAGKSLASGKKKSSPKSTKKSTTRKGK